MALILCFAIWSFGIAFVRNPFLEKETARIFENIASIGWISFSSFFLWFTVLLTERQRWLNSKVFFIAIFTPPVFFICLQWFNLLMEDSSLQFYGWLGTWSESVWPYFFYLYYLSFMLLGCYLVLKFHRKTTNAILRKQGRILVLTALVALLLGTVSNVILRRLYIYNIPPLADVLTLIWASGLAYITARYRFLVTPATAAEEIISTMSECMLLLDHQGRVITANKAALELLEYGKEELTGHSVDEVVADEDFNTSIFPAMLQGNEFRDCDLIFNAKSGKQIPVSFSDSILRDSEKQMAGIVCIATDITDRKQTEERLRKARDELEVRVAERTAALAQANKELEAEIEERRKLEKALLEESQRLAITLQSIADGVIALDMEGNIVLMNETVEKLTGWTMESARGRPLRNVLTVRKNYSMDGIPVDISGNGATVTPGDHIAHLVREGLERTISYSIAPIRDKENRTVGAVLVIRDITEKLKMEAELLNMAKLESLGVLAGGVAHDYNNLLTAILTNLSLLKRSVPADDPRYHTVVDAERASLLARDLSRQLVTFSKGGAPIKTVASLSNLIRDTGGFALSGAKAHCRFSIADDLWPTEVDTGQISQVMQNIVINAVQAMPEGGYIDIAARNRIISQEDALPLPPGRYIELFVKDEGCGIPSRHLPFIFDPYYTTKKTGSGLGLATAYSIIKKHEGHIAVTSEEGKGAAFHIYLPVTEKREPESEKKFLLPGVRKGKILLMDDKEIVLTSVSNALRSLGYEIIVSTNAEETVEKYIIATKEHKPFDIVILDITIPGGIGGKEALERLMRIDPDITAIASSGYTENPILSEYKQYGFSEIAVKPYDIDELDMTIQRIIQKESKK